MSESGIDPATSRWHIDRRVPLSLIIAIAVQTAAIAFWGGQLTQRVVSLETENTRSLPNAERIARMEQQLKSVAEVLAEVKRNQETVREELIRRSN